MKRVLNDIQSGKFTREWMQENKVGQTSFKATAPARRHTRSRKSARSCAT